MDNGYYDMSKIMQALVDVKFKGIIILDHTPALVNGGNAPTAYGVAYMTALLSRCKWGSKGA
jgi:mannonate dehydratase